MTNSVGWTDLDLKAVNTIRALAADAVQKTGNGHPGTAISLAPVAYLIYQNKMRFDPTDDQWLGRDRFVLSCGHSSLTQYIQLYLAGVDLELSDLEAFRTYESKTPGHPEVHHTKGIEVTTGPLGQGVGMGVGLAMAARRERGLFDPNPGIGESPFDHHVYVVASDGDMMEGVSNEASSIAGHQELGNLILIWDDNHISIEDETEISFTEDVPARYEALGWHVQRVDWTKTGKYEEDIDALDAAIEAAKAETSKPSFIALRTIMAWPSPTKQNTGSAHGSALGDEEVAGLKKVMGFDPEKTFDVDPKVLEHTRNNARKRGEKARAEWQVKMDAWATANPEGAKLLERLSAKKLPEGWEKVLPEFPAGKGVATRAASGDVLTALADTLPELWGGSADLASSNNTTMEGQPSFVPGHWSTTTWEGNPYGRTLHFGIREFGMGTILNGIAMHGGITRSYGGTFLTFSDYMRNSVRLAAIMDAPATFVWTHDSVGLGEDGPTHQPIEQIQSLRLIPDFDVVRPADANETVAAWRAILENRRAAGIILTRQKLETPERGTGEASGDTLASVDGVAKGAYILAEAKNGTPQVILIATGSEVEVALAARKQLADKGVEARVVSMPCLEWFKAQDEAYQEKVLPADIKARVSIEAGATMGWKDIVGDAGRCIGINHYGASADGALLMKKFGITPEATVAAAEDSIAAAGK